MCQVSRFRSANNLVTIPVGKAVYCSHCENITNSPGDRCCQCGSDFVLQMATLIIPPPNGPDSGPASAGHIVPAFHLELAKAA